MYHPQPTLANNPLDQVDNISADSKFNNMFGALSAAAAANFAAVANFASCPASTSTSSPFASQSIPSIASNPGPCFAPQLVGQPTKRERTKYSEYQLAYLEGIFRELAYPDAKREEIARILQLTDVKVQVWFKNRRAKMRNEQKFEKMKREAAKVAASRKQQQITVGGVKREESVEDTEEEDPGKGKIEGAKVAKCKMESANGNCLKPPPSPPMAPYQFGATKAEEPQIAAVSTPATSTFAHQWPPNPQMMPMEMGSLMQMAAASSAAAAQNQNFYSGWTSPSASNVPNYHLLPSPYGGAASSVAAGQMFNTAAMAAAYYPSSTNCNYNYYFPPQMSAAMVASTEEQK